jgi:CheY-like chemotaxis protein
MEVTTAINGHQAFELLSKTMDFDLVVLDLHMPISDGYETCANIVKLYNEEKIFGADNSQSRSKNSLSLESNLMPIIIAVSSYID